MAVISAPMKDTTKALLLGVVGMVIMPIFFSTSAMYLARRGMRNSERGASLAFHLGAAGVVFGTYVFVRYVQSQLQ